MRAPFSTWSGDRIELSAMVLFLFASIALFGTLAPQFLSGGIFRSMAFQLPELGLLTLAMFIPIIAGGLNLAVTFTANICALAAAFFVKSYLMDAGAVALPVALLIGMGTGLLVGHATGAIVAYVGAHPILVTLGAMIFLRGLGELLTRGGDISGLPDSFTTLGHESILGVPIPMLVFLLAVGLMSLQVIASGMNLMGASQHLATAAWGGFLILVMILRAPFQTKR